jgi:ribonuclease P protein component
MSPRFGFGRRHRLTKRKEFERVYQQGMLVKDECFRLYALPKPEEEDPMPRLGLSVSKKLGKAVRRNRVKRLVREWFRAHKDALWGFDVIVQAKPPAADLNFHEICQRLDALAAQLRARTSAESEG